MNRLVIIGNGFDLAHGLPTSYRDFIDDFWKNFKDKCKTEEYKQLIFTHDLYDKYYSEYKAIGKFDDLLLNIKEYCIDYPEYYFDEASLTFYTERNSVRDKIFEFKNNFFKRINVLNSEKWVDIETEYYKNLISIAKSDSLTEGDKEKEVKVLNSEFGIIKKLLNKYLKENICDKYEFKLNESNEIINYLKSEINTLEEASLQSYSTLLLSFNYTPLARIYSDYLKNDLYNTNVNYIHGEIGNTENQDIIFGYGDDKDENYKIIKDFNNNDFLENIKPFDYKNNENFENLLEFINQSKFKVYLIGHSCGLSDRYLLNNVFENKNCDSINVLYRIYDDGTDDFKNKTRDISRHFDDDRQSIIRIVNKKKNISMFQNIRFNKKTNDFDYEIYS